MANSTLQVTCAAMLVVGAAIHAQTPCAETRVSLAREIADSASAIIRAGVADSAFPGAYVIIGDSSGVLAEAAAGHLDWNPSAAPDRHTLWDLASLTKVVGTTTAMAQLVERGAIELDAPVQRYLPDWVGSGKNAVTVRHLLTHTSGLHSFRNYDQQTHNPDSLAALLYADSLDTVPGDRMVYSDIGAFIMGRVIERVSGEPLDVYLGRHVLAPLRMTETMFNPPANLRDRIAPTEIDSTRGGLVRGFVHDERAYYLGGVAAHAGLFSSAADLARFATMLLRGGALDGARVLRPETVERFTRYADSTFSNRALGWQKPSRPGMRQATNDASWAGNAMSSRAFGHTGFTGTSIAVEPALNLYIVLLTNRVNPTRRNLRILDVRAHLADAVVSTVRRHLSESPTGTHQ